MPYEFGYKVKDEPSYNDFGHQESSDGTVVSGSYSVLLPDGRTQTVTYTVSGDSGYVAEVKYEGEAQYPENRAAASYPAPAYPAPASPSYPAPAEEVAAPVEEVAAPVEEVAAPVEEVAAPVEEVAAPVEEVAAPVEEVAAPVEEVAAPVEEVAEQVVEVETTTNYA